MTENLETYLSAALRRLEKAAGEIVRNEGLTKEAEAIKVLTELVKEQTRHEDPRSAARQAG